MPGRNDRAAPPPPSGGYSLVFLRKNAADGWEEMCKQWPGPMRRAYNQLSSRPVDPTNHDRQHKLRFDLEHVKVNGALLEQWQYEVNGPARIWYAVNSLKKLVWISHAGTGHPSKTD